METQCVDASAVDGLVDRNYAAVYRYAYRLTGCAATAEDVTQDVFVKAIAHLHQLRQREAERGWLMSITRREFMRWLREVASPASGRPVPLDTQNIMTDDHQVQRLEDKDWVQSALCSLNEDARVALLMYYFEELSYAEIALQLQIPIGTVMSRLSRGREHLRQALERMAPSSPVTAEGAVPSQLAPVVKNLAGHALDSHSLGAANVAAHVLGEHEGAKPTAQEAKHG